MASRWYQEAVIYSVDVSSFQDSDGDGRGDLRGLISRLDYLSRLGVSCLWLNPDLSQSRAATVAMTSATTTASTQHWAVSATSPS